MQAYNNPADQSNSGKAETFFHQNSTLLPLSYQDTMQDAG
jgi:hypothetical protein